MKVVSMDMYLNEFYLDVSSVGRLQNVLQIHV